MEGNEVLGSISVFADQLDSGCGNASESDRPE